MFYVYAVGNDVNVIYILIFVLQNLYTFVSIKLNLYTFVSIKLIDFVTH